MEWLAVWWTKARRVTDFLRPMQISLHSAYTSFFLILSLFPFLLLFLGALRYTSLGVKELLDILRDWLPESLLPTVSVLVEASYRHTSGAVVSISVAAALYSASRGMLGVRNGLDAVYRRPLAAGYLRRRSLSILYTLTILPLLVLTLAVYLLGNAVLDFLWMTTNPLIMRLLGLIDLRWVLLAALQSLLFTLMYAWLPTRRNRLRQSIPGAVVACLGWLIFSKLFSVYMTHFSSYTNIFGSIYALALGMLWLYFCISIFFYGGALNCYLAQHRNT